MTTPTPDHPPLTWKAALLGSLGLLLILAALAAPIVLEHWAAALLSAKFPLPPDMRQLYEADSVDSPVRGLRPLIEYGMVLGGTLLAMRGKALSPVIAGIFGGLLVHVGPNLIWALSSGRAIL
jgi:hypothetical protein